jgi:oxygen-independent coproporphyrinogen-3 oxidase
MKNNVGLYIHIPFCVRKCRYCDFLSFPCGREDRSAYIDALCGELAARGPACAPADTVFIGGGTPSVLEEDLILKLGEGIRQSFDLADGAEFSVEANPGTLTEEKIRAFREIGVNRVSLGVQSFDDGLLKTLGRVHSAAQAEEAVRSLRENGIDNINLDLMFALPGQSAETWEKTLRQALTLEPEHLSFYGLTFEEGTPFFEELQSGKIRRADDETDRKMYHRALVILKDAGYRHYEISNAVRPGFESRHNLKYWTMADYVGCGLGAHSYLNGVRSAVTSDFSTYLNQKDKTAWSHKNTEKDIRGETVFTGLRLVEGLSKELFRRKTGREIGELYREPIGKMVRQGLLEETDTVIRLTGRGLDLANVVMEEFIEV